VRKGTKSPPQCGPPPVDHAEARPNPTCSLPWLLTIASKTTYPPCRGWLSQTSIPSLVHTPAYITYCQHKSRYCSIASAGQAYLPRAKPHHQPVTVTLHAGQLLRDTATYVTKAVGRFGERGNVRPAHLHAWNRQMRWSAYRSWMLGGTLKSQKGTIYYVRGWVLTKSNKGTQIKGGLSRAVGKCWPKP
jgi:hypothetical protein